MFRLSHIAGGEGCDLYAMCSQSPSGLALLTADGAVHAGGAIESCAYNPSMSPLQVNLPALHVYLPALHVN
jgi:cytidine deaminase